MRLVPNLSNDEALAELESALSNLTTVSASADRMVLDQDPLFSELNGFVEQIEFAAARNDLESLRRIRTALWSTCLRHQSSRFRQLFQARQIKLAQKRLADAIRNADTWAQQHHRSWGATAQDRHCDFLFAHNVAAAGAVLQESLSFVSPEVGQTTLAILNGALFESYQELVERVESFSGTQGSFIERYSDGLWGSHPPSDWIYVLPDEWNLPMLDTRLCPQELLDQMSRLIPAVDALASTVALLDRCQSKAQYMLNVFLSLADSDKIKQEIQARQQLLQELSVDCCTAFEAYQAVMGNVMFLVGQLQLCLRQLQTHQENLRCPGTEALQAMIVCLCADRLLRRAKSALTAYLRLKPELQWLHAAGLRGGSPVQRMGVEARTALHRVLSRSW